ncbi:cation:proton antiporter [Rubrivirga litoralis]|uniref:Sodium:proton antiporter n=1 Tax=Rubrivirga litoralis TaxID=3075598 RepID=A0ABU3BRB4_9BACT|nr:sodium:proton antiporter [Rubrivirga sp. F394]MDT0631832.1 sodium:proton antiporter [Rubrivirga sp. F394]
MSTPLVTIAAVVVLGIGAQWVAWRTRLPSILLLLAAGFLAGPVTGFLPQEALQGEWLFPFVSLAVGIILFEGGLTLRFDEFREVGRSVINLITIGVGVTGVLGAVGAHYLAGFSWEVAIVLGALLTVTGPTVVLPLLRQVRPAGRVGTIAKWEGITIDPIGAILAVLVLETVILLREPAEAVVGEHASPWSALATGIAYEVVVGVGVAALSAGLLILLLRRRLVPDWLQNPVALMVVIAAFAISNALQEEAGLLEATLLGIFMANQKYVSVRRIVEFKEDLRVLLISLLFIVLSARLDPSAFEVMLAPGPLLFLGALMLVVRPLAVVLSSLGTGLTWKEQAFLSWLAPRGIVAAAVASLFAFRLEEFFPEEAALIVPVVFLIIVGTVAVYGLTISPVARALGLALPNPQGILFVGAQPWVRRVAKALQDLGVRTLLIDANARNVRLAVRAGLPAKRANVLAEGVIDDLDLSGLGRLLAVTPNDEVNSLAALHFGEVFESNEVFQIPVRSDGPQSAATEIPRHLRGRPLFSTDATYTSLDERFDAGAEIRVLRLADGGAGWLREASDDGAFTPLFVVRGEKVRVYAEDADITPQPGDALVALVDPDPESEALWRDAMDGADLHTPAADDRTPSNAATPPPVAPPGNGQSGAPATPPRA